jgi:hypothetical protein
MRTPASLLLASTIALAASLHVCAANAGGLYVGVAVPVAVTAPLVTPVPVVVQPAVVDPVPTVVIGPDYYYCCGPGWRGYGWHGAGWHGAGWRGYGWHGYGERGYVHPGPIHAGYVHGPAARAEVRRGRR